MTAHGVRGVGREDLRAGLEGDHRVEAGEDSRELREDQLAGSQEDHQAVSGRGLGNRRGRDQAGEDPGGEWGASLLELPGHSECRACPPCSSEKVSTWSWSSGWTAASLSRPACRCGGRRSSEHSWPRPRHRQHPQPGRRRFCRRCRSRVRIYAVPTQA